MSVLLLLLLLLLKLKYSPLFSLITSQNRLLIPSLRLVFILLQGYNILYGINWGFAWKYRFSKLTLYFSRSVSPFSFASGQWPVLVILALVYGPSHLHVNFPPCLSRGFLFWWALCHRCLIVNTPIVDDVYNLPIVWFEHFWF